MLRLSPALYLLAACYRPPLEASCEISCATSNLCPSGFGCMNGFCAAPGLRCGPDGEIITGDDAPPTVCLSIPTPTSWTTQTADMMLGSSMDRESYTIDIGRTTAVYDVSGTAVQFGPINTTVGFQTIVSNTASDSYHGPHIVPEGDEVFAHDKTLNKSEFVKIARTSQTTWGPPVPIVIRRAGVAQVFGADVVPGTTTTRGVSARRMMIAVAGQLWELVEEPDLLTWIVEPTVLNPGFFTDTTGPLTFIDDPSISPDGLRMVFVGARGGVRAVYATTRPAPVGPWSAGVTLVHQAGELARHPFLSADCKELYFYLVTSNVVRNLTRL